MLDLAWLSVLPYVDDCQNAGNSPFAVALGTVIFFAAVENDCKFFHPSQPYAPTHSTARPGAMTMMRIISWKTDNEHVESDGPMCK